MDSFVRMKHVVLTSGILLLAACTNPPSTADVPSKDSTHAAVGAPIVPASWTGYYTDTIPCADCPGIDITLWVRGDSTFVMQQRYIGRDTIPWGTIGQWHTVNGLLTIGAEGDKPDFYRYTREGLLMVDEMGVADTSSLDWTLDKLADDIGDAIPRMRLRGAFTCMAGAQRMRPCGTRFSWPCVGGMDMGEEEGEPLIPFTNVDLLKTYRNAVKRDGEDWTIEAICTMGMGPAMEGDGADEYIFIEQAPRAIADCP